MKQKEVGISGGEAHVGEDLASFRIHATTLGDLLLIAADRSPAAPAIVFPELRLTYRELADRSMERARMLRGLGVRPREHVGILLPSGIEFIETLFAIALCGGVAVLVNARYKAAEIAYVAENADLVAIVTTDAVADQVDFVERLHLAFPDLAASSEPARLRLAGAPKLRSILLLGRTEAGGILRDGDLAPAAAGVSAADVHAARVRVRVRDVGMILYTSGTSANPKGCLLTHEAIVRNSIVAGRHRWRMTATDRVWSPLPLFHIGAILPLLSVLDVGGTFLGMTHFEPGQALRMIEENRVTLMFSPFVNFLQALLYHPDFKRTDLSSVTLVNSCFAVQPPAVGEAYRAAMPGTLQVGTFGMTETSGIVSTGTWEMDRDLSFSRLGVPLTGLELRITDPATGEVVPDGGQGEVLVRGYSLFEGYYKDAGKTAEVLDAEGWYHSGDLGSVDAGGHVMFHGRLKDMLKVGGENVAAAEVEAVLERHPAVRLAQVVGIPDERLTEVPAAFVELAPGATATEAELLAYCRREIASFKTPRLVRFLSEWPMSVSKIQKYKLREALLRELGATLAPPAASR